MNSQRFPVLPYPPIAGGVHTNDVEWDKPFVIEHNGEVLYRGYSAHTARLIKNTMEHNLIEGEEP